MGHPSRASREGVSGSGISPKPPDIDATWISRLENGKVNSPRYLTLRGIAETLDLTPEQLLAQRMSSSQAPGSDPPTVAHAHHGELPVEMPSCRARWVAVGALVPGEVRRSSDLVRRSLVALLAPSDRQAASVGKLGTCRIATMLLK